MPHDFTLPGRTPADATSTQLQQAFLEAEEVYDLLACDHRDSPDGADDFLLFEDLDAHAGLTDLPALAARLHQPADTSTFTLTTWAAPTFALAAAWLVAQGAEAGEFLFRLGHPGAPAEPRSADIAARLLAEPTRYVLVEHGMEGGETWAMLRDSTAAGAARPFLLQLETVHPEGGYTLREGAFATPQDVQQWLEHRRAPLPPVAGGDVAVLYSPQASAARTRTASPVKATNRQAVSGAAVPVAAAGRRTVR